VFSMHDMLAESASDAPRTRAVFLTYAGDTETATEWDLAELDARARAIAEQLTRRYDGGDRLLLLYPPGLDFLAAFFACGYAGMAAIPAYPPDPTRLDRTLPRLLDIIRDAGARRAHHRASRVADG
jgi:acyl-CoA synthetase (AMP-forming)/AMP-acid ligase II